MWSIMSRQVTSFMRVCLYNYDVFLKIVKCRNVLDNFDQCRCSSSVPVADFEVFNNPLPFLLCEMDVSG